MRKFGLGIVLILIIGFLLPESFQMPVRGANSADYHPDSFWYHPWGKSGTHKGIDIFAKEGTPVLAATQGIVLYTGELRYGGKVVFLLGPKWRIHYYAHLNHINTHRGKYCPSGEVLGEVGSTGNAIGKPAHLHYSIGTLIPYPWRIDSTVQGWKKMFYLDPTDFME